MRVAKPPAKYTLHMDFSSSMYGFSESVYGFSTTVWGFRGPHKCIHGFFRSPYIVSERQSTGFRSGYAKFWRSIYKFSKSTCKFSRSKCGISTPKSGFGIRNDLQRSNMEFDHLNVDVWRLRKPNSTSKVTEL